MADLRYVCFFGARFSASADPREGEDAGFAFDRRSLGFENDARGIELVRERSFRNSAEAAFYRDLIVTKMR